MCISLLVITSFSKLKIILNTPWAAGCCGPKFIFIFFIFTFFIFSVFTILLFINTMTAFFGCIYILYSINYILTITLLVCSFKSNFLPTDPRKSSGLVLILIFLNLSGVPVSSTFFLKLFFFLKALSYSYWMVTLILFLNGVFLYFYQKLLLVFFKKKSTNIYTYSKQTDDLHIKINIYFYWNFLFTLYWNHILVTLLSL